MQSLRHLGQSLGATHSFSVLPIRSCQNELCSRWMMIAIYVIHIIGARNCNHKMCHQNYSNYRLPIIQDHNLR